MRRSHAGLAVVILCLLCGILCMPVPLSAAPQRKVTMILWDGITPNEQGFQDGLREAGYDVAFEIFDVHGHHLGMGVFLKERQQIIFIDV